MLTSGNQNVLGFYLDGFGLGLLDADSVGTDKASPALEVFNRVVAQVTLIDTIKTLDVSISLAFQESPVERRHLLEVEAIAWSVAQSFSDRSYNKYL